MKNTLNIKNIKKELRTEKYYMLKEKLNMEDRKNKIINGEYMSKNRKKKNQYKNIGTNNLNYTNKLREDDVVIILQDIEFAWNKKDISKVKQMWNENYSFKEILKEIKREGDELFLLLLHLARKNQIKERVGFIWGK